MLKIGHRGAPAYEPENTLKSFAKAITLWVDMIELDIHVCATGELVVIHDDEVDRTTDGHGLVIEKSIDELRKLDTGNGEKIPLLSEVLDLVDKEVQINIELKGPHTAEKTSQLIGQYITDKGRNYDDFLVSSFDHEQLKTFHTLNPYIKIWALTEGYPEWFLQSAQDLWAYSVNLDINFITKAIIDDAHQKGLKVMVRTVDGVEDIEKMKAFGVDGIFSNVPDRL